MGDRSSTTLSSLARRAFLQLSVAGSGAFGVRELFAAEPLTEVETALRQTAPARAPGPTFGVPYAGDRLNRIAFPLGGLGAGMVCLEGTGAFSHVSLRHQPDVFNSPLMFAALGVKGHPELARVLEAPVPEWKLFGGPGTANGAGGTSYGLPRLAAGTFLARFPFAMAVMRDRRPPIEVTLTGWSPFEPNDPDGSSLPVAGLEYRVVNRGRTRLDAVFSFHARNFMGTRDKPQAVRALDGGFELWGGADTDKPWEAGSFAVVVDEPGTTVDHAWFRGGWWDPLTLAWKAVTNAATIARPPVTEGQPAPGGSLFVPVALEPGASRTIRVKLAWYVPLSHLRSGKDPAGVAADPDKGFFRAWYAGRFDSLGALVTHWRTEYDALRTRSLRFSECLHDTTLPPEVTEAVAANLSILKSPTVLRQDDGRMWAWEGCGDSQRLLPRHLHARVELRAGGAAPVPVARADAARDRVRPVAGRHRPPDVPRVPADPAGRARLPRRRRRTARRHPQGAPRLARQRRHRVAARAVAEGDEEPRLLHRDLGSAAEGRARGAAPQHLRHRVLGPERHVHQLLSGCAAGGGADGRGAGQRRRAVSRSAGEGHGGRRDGPLERRVLHPEDPVGGPARRQPDRRRRAWSASIRRRRSRS